MVLITIKFKSLYANFVKILDACKRFSTKNTMPRQCVTLYFLYLLFSLLRGVSYGLTGTALRMCRSVCGKGISIPFSFRTA